LGMLTRIALIAVLLAGCSGEPSKPVRPYKTLAERKALAQEGLAKTPTPRTYRIDGNELKVIDVPVLDSTGLLDVQRCFVWRDQEFRSSTLSCGQMPEIFIHKD
jgi:hypothetical protein